MKKNVLYSLLILLIVSFTVKAEDNVAKGKIIGKVVDKALEKLLCTVDSMDEHRIEQLSIKDAANVAAQMSKVVNNMNPKESPTQFQAGQLIIYAPAQYNENRYEVVELGQ